MLVPATSKYRWCRCLNRDPPTNEAQLTYALSAHRWLSRHISRIIDGGAYISNTWVIYEEARISAAWISVSNWLGEYIGWIIQGGSGHPDKWVPPNWVLTWTTVNHMNPGCSSQAPRGRFGTCIFQEQNISFYELKFLPFLGMKNGRESF